MPRGGYQKPKNPAPVSGPGRFSRRTDGAAPSPDIDTERGLQYGDRKMLEDAARIQAPAGSQGAPIRMSPAGGGSRRPAGAVPTRGGIPPWLLGTPDTAPDEPTTAGLDMGAGPGSEILDAGVPTDDQRVMVLRFWAETYGNEDAKAMLAEMREQQSAVDPMQQLTETMPVTGDGLDAFVE